MNNSLSKIKTYLVVVNSPKGSIENDNEEFISLTLSTGASINGIAYINSRVFNRNTLIGKGKIETISKDLENIDADLIIFNRGLSASQERNLEKILLSTRLVRGWTHLERQKGGIGLRGPGEKQLETDRRLLNKRIKSIELKLRKLRTQRLTNRKSRNKLMKNVALVGYTNAGKSTLFNTLSNSNTLVADKMFATLDPVFRPINISKKRKVIISDTVGFIRELPKELIEAFLSTLEEVSSANLILHVLDSTDRSMHQHKQSVEKILKEIGADQIPVIYAYNKSDLVNADLKTINTFDHIQISAKNGTGINLLLESISSKINPQPIDTIIRIGVNESKIRSEIYNISNVLEECLIDENTLELKIQIDDKNLSRMKKNKKIKAFESKLVDSQSEYNFS